MSLKYNTKQRNKSIQGLRSFKDTLPKNVKKILVNPEGIAKIIYFMCSDEAALLKGSIRTE